MSLIEKKNKPQSKGLTLEEVDQGRKAERESFELRFFFPKKMKSYGKFDSYDLALKEAKKIARRLTTSRTFEIVRNYTCFEVQRFTFQNTAQKKKFQERRQKQSRFQQELPIGTIVEVRVPKSKHSKKSITAEAEVVDYRADHVIIEIISGQRKGDQFQLNPDKHSFAFSSKFERW